VLVLDAQDFWAATGAADRGRIDMLEVLPGIRQFVLNTGRVYGSLAFHRKEEDRKEEETGCRSTCLHSCIWCRA
jgi:hypothetical protein